MCTSARLTRLLVSFAALTHAVTVHRFVEDITSKTRTELPQIRVICGLNDILILSVPVISTKISTYHLYSPNGEIRKLKLKPNLSAKTRSSDYDTLSVKTYKERFVITNTNKFRVFNANYWQTCITKEEEDEFSCQEREMGPNEFMLGPLSEDDYGNWILSAFYKDESGDWAEVYQMVSIDIRQTVPATTSTAELKPGETFEFGFAYPINDLTSCELIAPKSTFDRFYSMDQIKLTSCGYVMKNVTSQDAGLWRIRGVGRITYETYARLEIAKNNKFIVSVNIDEWKNKSKIKEWQKISKMSTDSLTISLLSKEEIASTISNNNML